MPGRGNSHRQCASREDELQAHNHESEAISEEWHGHTIARLPRFSKAYARRQNKRQLSRRRQRDRYVKQTHMHTVVDIDAYGSGDSAGPWTELTREPVTEVEAMNDSWASFEWIESILSEDLLMYVFEWLPVLEALLMRRTSRRVSVLIEKCLKTKRAIVAGDFPPPYEDFWHCIVRGWNGYDFIGDREWFPQSFVLRAMRCIEYTAKACPNIEKFASSTIGQRHMYIKLLEQFPRLRNVVQEELALCHRSSFGNKVDIGTLPEVLHTKNLDLYVSEFGSGQWDLDFDQTVNFVRRCRNVTHLRLTPDWFHEAQAPEVYNCFVPILRRLLSVESLHISYGRDSPFKTPKSAFAYRRECEILLDAFPRLTALTLDTRYHFESSHYEDLSSAVSESFGDQLQALHLTDSLPRHFKSNALTRLRELILDVEVVSCATADTPADIDSISGAFAMWGNIIHVLTEEMINEKRNKQQFLLDSLSTMSVFPESLRTLTVNLTTLESRNPDCEPQWSRNSRCDGCSKALAEARDELLQLGAEAGLQMQVTLKEFAAFP